VSFKLWSDPNYSIDAAVDELKEQFDTILG
jgi:hypothetical protein